MALPPRVAVNPTLHPALQYQQCAKCHYVGGANEHWGRSDLACPNCGDLGSPTIFPGDFYGFYMFPKLQRLYEERNVVIDVAGTTHHAFTEVVTVFSIFITESILYTTTKLALQKLGVRPDIAKLTLDVLKGSQELADYLAQLCEAKSISKILKPEPNLRNVWDNWEHSRTMRNKIAHGSTCRCLMEDAEQAFEVAVRFPGVARHILNQVPGLDAVKIS